MKKIICGIIITALAFTLCACNASTSAFYSQSYFLEDSRTAGVGTVNETLEYEVAYTQSLEDSSLKISVDSANSSYKTTLTNAVYNEKNCCLLKTELKIAGEMNNNGQITAIDDTVTSECYFLGLDTNLAPLYSKKSVKSHSPFLKSTNVYEINYYDYQIETVYADGKATATFKIGEGNKGAYDIADGDVTEYANYNKSAYIDNELLLFAPRAMNLKSVGASFYTIDVISKVNRKMKIANDSVATESINEKNIFYLNSKGVSDLIVNNTVISIDSNYSGRSIKATYASTDNADCRCVMVKLTQYAFYELGEFNYTLKLANNKI